MKKYIGLILELVVFAVLLYIVWHNAHWSVSLTLTLMVLTFQVNLTSTRYIKVKKRGSV